LFPVAGQSLFLINAPSFDRTSIQVPGGEFVIEAEDRVDLGPDDAPLYVQSVTLDGELLDRTWITGRELHRPGRLVVSLGPEPSPWGTGQRPPSGSSRPSPSSHPSPSS
jgi:putative alpha-1,2-mannosidase